MGWAHCGRNRDTGDMMGYGVEGVCAHPECDAQIDHGLSYLCGDMHADGVSCNRYFCDKHLSAGKQRCDACWKEELCCWCCGEHAIDCECTGGPQLEAECSCYEPEFGHAPGCALAKRRPDQE